MCKCTDCVRPPGWCCSRDDPGISGCRDSIMRAQIEVVSLPEVCSWCAGACCVGDQIADLPKHYLQQFNLPRISDRCPACDPETGCVLPREGRPDVCLFFKCQFISYFEQDEQMWQFCREHGHPVQGISTYHVRCAKCPYWDKCRFPKRERVIEI